MDDTKQRETKEVAASLTVAIRTARLEQAERSQVVGDLRRAEYARLDLLREAIEPVLAQVPADVDLFDIGLVSGDHPRLFLDMVSFVEMGRDRRLYRFVQDTRGGRVLLAENDAIGPIRDAITRYIARRLVEREKALAALPEDGNHRIEASPPVAEMRQTEASHRPTLLVGAARAFRLGVDGLGILALAGLVWLGVQYLQGRPPVW